MTREEEIKQVASFYQLSNSQEKFIEGAKWADQNPRKGLWDSKKVIVWLMENMNNYLVKGRDIDFIYEDLRKAMEE